MQMVAYFMFPCHKYRSILYAKHIKNKKQNQSRQIDKLGILASKSILVYLTKKMINANIKYSIDVHDRINILHNQHGKTQAKKAFSPLEM